jgi:hypothetical protein
LAHVIDILVRTPFCACNNVVVRFFCAAGCVRDRGLLLPCWFVILVGCAVRHRRFWHRRGCDELPKLDLWRRVFVCAWKILRCGEHVVGGCRVSARVILHRRCNVTNGMRRCWLLVPGWLVLADGGAVLFRKLRHDERCEYIL